MLDLRGTKSGICVLVNFGFLLGESLVCDGLADPFTVEIQVAFAHMVVKLGERWARTKN
jgi:hypothetical protein